MGTLEVNGLRWDMDKWLESTDYRVDPAWMNRVREVVDYVLDEGMYCILNVHHDTGDHGEEKNGAAWLVADKFDAAKDRYAALWQQIAETFKDYSRPLPPRAIMTRPWQPPPTRASTTTRGPSWRPCAPPAVTTQRGTWL